MRFQFTIGIIDLAMYQADHDAVLEVLKMAFDRKGGYQIEKASGYHIQGGGHVSKAKKIRADTVALRLRAAFSDRAWFNGSVYVTPEVNCGFKLNALARYNTKQDHTYISGPYEWGTNRSDEYKYTGQDLDGYTLRGHALQMRDIIDNNCGNERAIIWFHDEIQEIGKTQFMRWFSWEHREQGVLQLSLSDADRMAMALYDHAKFHQGKAPQWLLIDIPYSKGVSKRTFGECMSFLEAVKGRWVRNNRYQGGELRWHWNTTIIVTANIRAPSTGRKNRFIEHYSKEVGPKEYTWIEY